MLSNPEIQSIAHIHGPTRNSSLRQVTSTYEHPDTAVSKSTELQQSAPLKLQQQSHQTLFRKALTLGVHDGSPTGSIALLDLNAFSGTNISSGTPITIEAASEAAFAAEDGILDGDEELTSRGPAVPNLRNGRSKHLFLAEPMDPDMITKSSDIQVCTSLAVGTTTRD